DVADVEILVLEEADRMVALGLAPDLRKLLKLLPETRQTLLFTLTMPPELNRLAKEALVEPVRVDVGPVTKPVTGITQAIYPVTRDLKLDLIDDLLARSEVRNTIVLTRARTSGDRLARQLMRRGYAVAVLDEHPSQDDREQALEDLRRGRMQILVASETSARSLDVAGTAHSGNYDVPQTPEDYVHRLGRAGRSDSVGDAFTLMSPEEQKDVDAIERFLGRAIPRVMLPDFDYGMHPAQIKQVVSYDDEIGDSRGGVAVAAARIATVHRPQTANGEAPRKTAKPAPAKPAVSRGGATNGARALPKKPSKAAKPAKPAARPASRTAKKPARAR